MTSFAQVLKSKLRGIEALSPLPAPAVPGATSPRPRDFWGI